MKESQLINISVAEEMGIALELAEGVHAGRVAVQGFKAGHHRLQCHLADLGGSGVICVNLH